jgi:hypothetical protein
VTTSKSRKRPKGYHDWSPRTATLETLEQIQAILAEYEEFLPLTVRQIFYRMVGRFDYEKTQLAYKNLSDKLTLARRAGMIPFESIRDDGVVVYMNRWHDGIPDFMDDVGRQARLYRRDRQSGQRVRMELWAESVGMLPQLDNVASRYSIPVYSAGGQPSVTANKAVAKRVLSRSVPTVVLHVGDFDPSGESIFESMSEDIRAFVRADRLIHTLDIEPVRVALTADQVGQLNLPTAPKKKTDSRSKSWSGGTCQLEALAPDLLAEIVEGAIHERIDFGVFADQVAREEDERRELLASPTAET